MAVSHRGAISFGMVHIPVGLYTAAQDNDIHFNQLCKEDGSRVKYKKVCAGCGKEVGPDSIVKGFEYEKGKYVLLTDEDFEKAKSEKDRPSTYCILPTCKASAPSITTKPITPSRSREAIRPLSCFAGPCWKKAKWRWPKPLWGPRRSCWR